MIPRLASSGSPVCVRLTDYPEERNSPLYGPYVYVQVMHGVLRGILQTGCRPKKSSPSLTLTTEPGVGRIASITVIW